ncbi:BCCT family transporter [Pontixanthobacter aestiaquae]|uniref:BCCT family transporter n=1 Tax=Pontixanthobacter aestiaquae TaxID=1509367 RepID=A0A844Z277_9SPHN|nr:BCCT family transporter [Pontixanthobacter aestiaquae]MDN3647256.1 BCCT family transporter [Pontixanthobacter aestiaquae]MXO81768.1 BCCT family transporter [Pontixanthobacter aestiaquae]
MSENTATSVNPPLVDLPIKTAKSGFYNGFSTRVTVPAKVIITLLILWVIVFQEQASAVLEVANTTLIREFAGWYVYLVAFLMLVAFILAVIPKTGELRLGNPGEKPEFSRFSWFAMLFGAGIGVGMLTYSTGEPLAHFQNNPDIIRGMVDPISAEAVRPAYIYTFLHWGPAAWATYALVGLAVGYVAYRRNLPLTIRSSLAPLFGKAMSGVAGHVVDIVAVVATILGVAVTMGLGVEQFVAGLSRLGFGDWLMVIKEPGASPTASAPAIIVALVLLVGASTISALSGVGRGIKWLSNLNMGLSFLLLAVFVVAGSGLLGFGLLATGIYDYIVALPSLATTLWTSDGTATGDALAQWQLDWSVFYWAWWIAFAPFVGMFIARVSRGRTVREYVLGVVLVPALMCFIWMAIVGGTAIDLELSGVAEGSILAAGISDQLFATLAVLFSPAVTTILSALVVLLLMTYLITSVDSAILIVNTINGAGDEEDDVERRHHILFWGAAIAFVVGGMLILGGTDAIGVTMIIGALPFSFVVALMAISIMKAIIFDLIRKKHDVPCTAETIEAAAITAAQR